MKNNQSSNWSSDIVWCLIAGFVILVPFFVVSLYNHPSGDDFWCTSLVRKYGYWDAQARLYAIVPPRYFELAISCLTPLSFGNFGLYKAIAPLFFLLFIRIMATSFRTLSGGKGISYRDAFLLAMLFVSVYLAVLPGIAEGIYWTSALTVYHTGIILFIVWCNCLLKWYYGNRSAYSFAGALFCLAGIFGCNEIISIIAVLVIFVLLFYKLPGKLFRKDALLLTQVFLSLLCVLFILRNQGLGNRYRLVHSENSGRILYSVGYALVLDGYYIGRCLLNPFFWLIIFLGYGPFRRFAVHFYAAYRRLFVDYPKSFFVTWLFVLVFIPFAIVYITGSRPPLRICNMIVFFFLYGFIGIATFAATQIKVKPGWMRLFSLSGGYKGALVLLLLIAGFGIKNNVSRVAGDLFSGSAAQFDRDWNLRYELIRQCKGDSCEVPALRSLPFAFWFSPDEDEPHISEYFNKQIFVRRKDH